MTLLFDTGALLDVIVVLHEIASGESWLEKSIPSWIPFAYRKKIPSALGELSGSLVTTTTVLVEVDHFVDRASKLARDKVEFKRLVRTLIEQHFRETASPLERMLPATDRDLYGIVDVSVAHAAADALPDVLVLTNDFNVFVVCAARSVQCQFLGDWLKDRFDA